MSRLWAVLRSIVLTIGAALAPILTEWAGKLMQVAIAARNWISQNQGLVVSILQIGLIVATVGVALTSLGGIISVIGTAFGVSAPSSA